VDTSHTLRLCAKDSLRGWDYIIHPGGLRTRLGDGTCKLLTLCAVPPSETNLNLKYIPRSKSKLLKLYLKTVADRCWLKFTCALHEVVIGLNPACLDLGLSTMMHIIDHWRMLVTVSTAIAEMVIMGVVNSS